MKPRYFSRISAALLTLLSPILISSAVYAQEGGGGAAAASAPAAAASSASSGSAGTTAAAPADAGAAAGASGTGSGTGADATPTQNAGESTADYLQRVIEGAASADTDDDAPGDDGTTDPAEMQAAIEGKDKEENTDKPAEEEKGAGGDGDGADDEFGYDPYLPPSALLAPKDLAAKINSDAALKAALDANPELRATLYDQSRAAAETSEFKKYFQSADEARVASDASREYNTLSDLVTSIKKPEDAQGFYNHLLQLSVLHDEEGNVVMRDGKPVSDGTVGQLIHHTGALFLNHFGQMALADAKAGREGDEELAAAVDILRDRAFGSKKERSTESLTEEQRTRNAELDAREKAQNERDANDRKASQDRFEAGIATAIDTHSDGEITRLLGRSDFPEGTDKAAIATKIRTAAYDLVAANDAFKIEQDALMRRAAGPKAHEARVGLAKRWMAKALPLVAPKIIAAEGGKIVASQQRSAEKQKERVDASRSEAGGVLRAAKTGAPVSEAELMKQVSTDFFQKTGRQPDTAEILQGVMNAKLAK